MSAQVAADLRAAADVLERDGWTREIFTSDDGCHCAAGAVGAAIASDLQDAIFGDRWRQAVEALAVSVGVSPWPIAVYRWNDAEDRTASEVIAALRAAADRAEASDA